MFRRDWRRSITDSRGNSSTQRRGPGRSMIGPGYYRQPVEDTHLVEAHAAPEQLKPFPKPAEYRLMTERGSTELLPLHPAPPPLRVDEGGSVRVGKSRVSLDLIVEQYENGMTPENMVRAYDTLVLADVHAVIAYHLRLREEVRTY